MIKTLKPIFILLLGCVITFSCSDDSEESNPKISINNAAGFEGENTIFTIKTSKPSDQTILVKYQIVHTTTTADDFFDMTSPDKKEIMLRPNETETELVLSFVDDELNEESEIFRVYIVETINADMSRDVEGIGTINDRQ